MCWYSSDNGRRWPFSLESRRFIVAEDPCKTCSAEGLHICTRTTKRYRTGVKILSIGEHTAALFSGSLEKSTTSGIGVSPWDSEDGLVEAKY